MLGLRFMRLGDAIAAILDELPALGAAVLAQRGRSRPRHTKGKLYPGCCLYALFQLCTVSVVVDGDPGARVSIAGE